MVHCFEGTDYQLQLDMSETSVNIAGGHFGEIGLLPSALFEMRVKNLIDGQSIPLSSESCWESVQVRKKGDALEFCFENPSGLSNLAVLLVGKGDQRSIVWSVEVINDNPAISVMEITYPVPGTAGTHLNYFIPLNSGWVLEDAGNRDLCEERNYPNGILCMQYFAVYGKRNGIYMGFEDGKAASKRFTYSCGNGECHLKAEFFGIGAGLPANSFRVNGSVRWEFFVGDWYDATMLYSDFVQREAKWLPELGENGRDDTPDRFKAVPFWVSDYIPNTTSQGDNKPMNLSAGSDIYEPEYWYKAPIQLQKELGVPIAYHVYNWHEIPFNIEYPHFLPAKQEFIDHVRELRENDIYVLPYINAVSWEMRDAETGHSVNFENTGCKGALINEDGSFYIEEYPQKTVSGKICNLSPACGSSDVWHRMIEQLIREIEDTLEVDGIYFDQVSASVGIPCYSEEHSHLPGGGSYSVEGYKRMMRKINAGKQLDSFYFSECNAEPFMKSFDGYLTWMWVGSGEVPAYPAVYAGYIELLGRCTIGNKKDDFEFFKYCTAKSLLYGQQLGWCKADVVYSPERMEFLKKVAQVRYRYTDLFHRARMLRPPVVETSLPKLVTEAGLWFEGDIVSEQVLSGAWRYRNGEKTVIFAVNISESSADYRLSFSATEYGIERSDLPAEFKLNGETCTAAGELGRYEIKVWEL